MTVQSTTLNQAEAMAQIAWSRRGSKSNPWLTNDVKGFARDMDHAGYQYDPLDYPSITDKWEQLHRWASSIAQNERDTMRGI